MRTRDVTEITFVGRYIGADPDSRSFPCGSVSEIPAKYVDRTGADGSIERTMIEPHMFVIAGIEARAVDALGWEPNRFQFNDAETGESKEFIGKLRDTMEPNIVKFAVPLTR